MLISHDQKKLQLCNNANEVFIALLNLSFGTQDSMYIQIHSNLNGHSNIHF